MSNQFFKKWEPTEHITGSLLVRGLYDDIEGFRVLLDEEQGNGTFRIGFNSHLMYRNIDESFYINQIASACSNDSSPWSLFIVENSDLKKIFIEQDIAKLNLSDDIIHYAIYTTCDCIDILALKHEPPILEWLNLENDDWFFEK